MGSKTIATLLALQLLLATTCLAAPPGQLLLSKRPLRRGDWAPNKRDGCPGYLTEGEYEFPHYITQISASQPDKAYGAQYNGVFTPNDISSVFSFDIPASRSTYNCTLEFLFPDQADLATSSYRISGAGTFVFSGYNPGDCPGPQTTYNNQPAPGPFPAFPAVHLEPGYAYVLDIGPCSVGAGTCVAGKTSTNDTTFTYFQDSGNGSDSDCPIGIYTTYSHV